MENPADAVREDYIKLPDHMCRPDRTRESLIDFTFPDLQRRHADPDGGWANWITERAILAPLNATATEINHRILDDYMLGESFTCYSSDRLMHARGELRRPTPGGVS